MAETVVNPALSALGLWQPTSEPIWSGVFPAGQEPDEAIVRSIRSFCPDFVPLYVTTEYLAPVGGERKRASYHAFGMHTNQPEGSEDDDALCGEPVSVLRPTTWPARFNGGRVSCVYVLSKPWPEDSWQFKCNMPLDPLPFDWRAEDWMRKTWHRVQKERAATLGFAEKNRMLAHRAAEEKAMRGVHEDIKLANRDDRYQLLRPLGIATSSTAIAPSKQPIEVSA